MAATAKQRAAVRENGRLGGGMTTETIELKRKARERALKMLIKEQDESIRFLVYMRDNPNVANSERIRCALELLSRGEVPVKAASYVGAAGPAGEMIDEPPKLVVLGRFKDVHPSEGNGHGNGDESA